MTITIPVMRRALLAGLLGSALTPAACTEVAGPEVDLTASWIVVVGSTCSGKLNSRVNIYIDNDYKGQTTVGSQLATTNLTFGLHELHAFTDGRVHEWGPDRQTLRGELTTTLDC